MTRSIKALRGRLEDELQRHRRKPAFIERLEVYLTDPDETPDEARLLTEVQFPIRHQAGVFLGSGRA